MSFLCNFIDKIAYIYLFYGISSFIYGNHKNNELINKILNNDKIIKYIINFSIKAIEYYSTGELYFNKFKRKIKNYIDSNPELKSLVKNLYKNKITENIECIKNGDVINRMTIYDFISKESLNADLYIYSDYNNENETVNKFIINDYENFINKYKNINTSNNVVKYEVTGYKFIMFEIIINNISVSVDMSTEKYNYLIIDNIFDSNFIKYFLKKYHLNIYNMFDDKDFTSYKIKIIDHNINVLEFDNKPLIISKEKGIQYLCDEVICKNENIESTNENNNVNLKNSNSIELDLNKNNIELKDNLENDDYDCIDIENYKYN